MSRSGGDLSALTAVITSFGAADCADISEAPKSTISRAGNNSFMPNSYFFFRIVNRLMFIKEKAAQLK